MDFLRPYLNIVGYSLLLVLLSCGTKESIEPAYKPVSIDSQLEARPVEVSLDLDSFDVPKFGMDFAKVSQLGPVFQELARHLANIAISDEHGKIVDIEPIIYYANELDQIEDWSYFSRLGFKKIRMNIQDSDDLELASLDFVDEVEVYVDFKEPESGQTKRKEGQGILVASYDREQLKGNLSCNGKCLTLNVEDIEWKPILKEHRIFTIYPVIKVNKVPKVKMSIGGEISVFVALKLGF